MCAGIIPVCIETGGFAYGSGREREKRERQRDREVGRGMERERGREGGRVRRGTEREGEGWRERGRKWKQFKTSHLHDFAIGGQA